MAVCAAEGVPVTTAALSSLLVYPTRDAPAVAVSLNDTRLDTEITGVVTQIPVQTGDRVTEGMTVAELDCERHEIAVDEAVAAYQVAQAKHGFNQSQLDNAQRLSKKRNISKEEVDKRKADTLSSRAELGRLQAAVKASQLTVRKCKIKAPFNAVVIEREASLGDYAVPGTPIVRLLDVANIEISAKIQEQDLNSLVESKDLHFASRNRLFPVQLRTVLPLMESRLGSYEARFTFTAEKTSPGYTGRLKWKSGHGHVPAELMVRRGDSLGIFIADDARARYVALQEARAGQPAPVVLPADTQVVVDGRFNIGDGDPILLQ